MSIELCQAGSLDLRLHVVARVLRVQDVEKRAPSDIELLAIGKEQVVRDSTLRLKFTRERSLILQSAPGSASVFFRLASALEQPCVDFIRPGVLLAYVRLIDPAGKDVPAQNSTSQQIGRAPTEAVDVMAGA